MRPLIDAVLGKNTRMKVTVLAMLLVTLFAWRAGWKESIFATFALAITGLASNFVVPHTIESMKKASSEEAPK